VNDDSFLDLFTLDLPDLTFCIPDPCDAVPVFPCPPIAGGAPAWWDDLWDFIGDIWGGAGDLAEKIGRSFSDLWDRIWGWVGGTVRWLYNQFSDAIGWIRDRVRTIWEYVTVWLPQAVQRFWNMVVDIWDWISHKIPDAIGWIRDRVRTIWEYVTVWLPQAVQRFWNMVVDIWDWISHKIPDAIGWIRDRVRTIWEYVTVWLPQVVQRFWNMVVDIWDWISHKIPDALDWVRNRLIVIWDFLRIDLWGHISGAAAGIGSAITDAFGDFVEMVQKGLKDLGDLLRDAIRWPWEHIGEPFVDAVQAKLAIPGKLFRGEYSSFPQLIDDMLDPAPLLIATAAGIFLLIMIVSYAFQVSTQTFVTPMALPYQQETVARVGAQLLTVGVVQEALDRGFIDEAFAEDQFSRMGYSGQAKHALIELCKQHPGASDLMRMADKRVWALQVPEKYGQYSELPDQVVEYMGKIGYSEEWTRNFWRAHWDLPSPNQVFEMLHRRVIETADIEQYLGLTDWLPFFRDKLLAISYNPITRVDLRRLYKLKIITEAQVKDGYMDLGYNEEKAGWLTEFTKQYANPEDISQLDDFSDLAVSTFRTAYRRGVITRDEALDRIVDAGYTEDVADFILSIDDAQLALNPTTDAGVAVRDLTVPIIRSAYAEKLWDRARAQQELEVLGYLPWEADLLLQLEDLAQQRELAGLQEAVVKELYLANAIDKAQAGVQLDAVGVLPDRRDLLLQRWELQKAQKPKRLTLAQLQKAFGKGIFTESEFLDELSAMGYNDRDAQIILGII
jgi:hypothetical protein